MVAQAFNPSTKGGRGRWISDFEASLVFKVSSRTARATQRNPVWGGEKQSRHYAAVLWRRGRKKQKPQRSAVAPCSTVCSLQ